MQDYSRMHRVNLGHLWGRYHSNQGYTYWIRSNAYTKTCEELWAPYGSHTDLILQGVEIILNNSASHHELRKYKQRQALLADATSK